MKRLIVCCIISFFGLMLLGAETKAPEKKADKPATEQVKEFTAAELAKFDGKEGRPAYVAANGIVYEVTGVGPWKSGKHGGMTPGTDITQAIKGAPHGQKVLDKLKVIGKLK